MILAINFVTAKSEEQSIKELLKTYNEEAPKFYQQLALSKWEYETNFMDDKYKDAYVRTFFFF